MRKFNILTIINYRTFSISSATFKKIQPSVKTKNVSSNEWLSRQLSDPFVELAKQNNYRCRSAFKLLEIDDKFKILRPGDVVVDCGASPGSWTQVAVKRVNSDFSDKKKPQGVVAAVDRQLLYPIEGATIFGNMDFTERKTQELLLEFLKGRKANAVISDMAPNATGVKDLDRENILKLCYVALKFAIQMSEVNSALLVKVWESGYTKKLRSDMERFYDSVKIVKPNASRSDSTEIFILGRGFKGLEAK